MNEAPHWQDEVLWNRQNLAYGSVWHNNGRPVLSREAITEQAHEAMVLACSVMGSDWYTERDRALFPSRISGAV